MRHLRLAVCAFWTVVLLSHPSHAQVFYGSVVGTVQDPSGAAVPRADVTITNTATGQSRRTETNELGRYSFSNILPGVYNLGVSVRGFKSFSRTDLTITINNVTRADVALEMGDVAETVTVEASAAALQTDKSDVHIELDKKEVNDLPLSNYRNYQSLINLVPGATPAQFQNAITDTPARALTTNINGTVRNVNTTRVDGATNVFVWLPHHTVYVPPSETIETVNVATNNFDAEQGMAGGAAITVNTKSGTNDFHGSAFAYHNNNRLRARNFFFRGDDKPKSINNIDGGTFGGPIRKNKLFFFGSWEGNRERVNFSRLHTVPTAAMRDGDFSGLGTQIFDPLTGNLDGSGRTMFAGARIPLSRQSAITRQLQELVPLPNQPGTNANFFNSGTQALNRDNYDVKINWNRTDRHTVWGKYSVMDAQVECGFGLGQAGGRGLCDGGPGVGDTFVQFASLGSTYVITPNLLVDGTFGYSRMGQQVRGPDFGQNFGSEVLGIPGTNGPDIRQSGMPIFAISGFETLGNPNNWSPLFRNDQTFTGTTNVSWTKGAHDMRFGYDVNRFHMNQWQPERGGNGPRGRFQFLGGITALQGGAAPNQFNALGDFLLGLPQTVGKSLQFFTPMSTREWQFGWYFRDRWQVTRDLTLTLGVRYEYYPLFTRAASGIEQFDPATNQVSIGRFGGVPDNVGSRASTKLWAPRVGLAYRLGNSTVIRSGYGITYDPLPISRPMRDPFPQVVNQDFLGVNSFQPFRPIEQGIPQFTGPDVSSGVIDLPLEATTRTLAPGTFRRGYIQSWNFFIERQLPQDFIAAVGYVGTRTVNQFALFELNAASPGGGRNGRPLAVQFGRTVDTELVQGGLNGFYNSLQTTINRRFRSGLFVKGAYTFSQAINETDDDAARLMFNVDSELRRNRALSGFDRTHNLQLAAIYDLPFGPGKTWASGNSLVSYLTRGWQINGLFSAFSGTPFTVTASGASLNAPGSGQTADQVKTSVQKLEGKGLESPFFDPAAFAPVTEVRFGTTGRNTLRGPGVVNLDAGVFRTFPLTERLNLQFRAEAFNVSNTPHFNNPNANVSNADFGTITSARQDERQFRFALRLSW
jgi:outer membrane receptor protein involved in Fe transport